MNNEEVSAHIVDIFKSSTYSKWDVSTSQRPFS
jgi:hypothetical protein